MKTTRNNFWMFLLLCMVLGFSMLMAGCGSPSSETEETAVTENHEANHEDEHDAEHKDEHEAEGNALVLPELSAVELDGSQIKVVATTSIIGDVVAQVGGDAIKLTTLMSAGQDPHSYEPGARELTAVAEADVIFVNGWDLEEALTHDLEEIGGGVPVVPISANIEPLMFGEGSHDHEEEEHEEDHGEAETEDEHHHSGADPHVWFSVHNVETWSENVAQVLSELDPANAETYEGNAAAYQEDLEELEGYAMAQLGEIPEENRFMVTNHDSFAYFAHEYGFEPIGTVIPAASTLAEPSANDLAGLIEEMGEHNLCTIFTETTVSDTLAQTVAAELSNCEDVQVIKLYTGSVGPVGSGADSYVGMFRTNVDAIVAGLQ